MRTSTFLHLPREIRDHIYKHVLRSPTGYIQYVVAIHSVLKVFPLLYGSLDLAKLLNGANGLICRRVSNLHRFAVVGLGEPNLNLSLLQTCRQIYEEAKDLVWEQNTYTFLDYEYSEAIKGRLGQRVRHVWTRSGFEIIRGYNQPPSIDVQLLSDTLDLFRQWAVREGQLETVTVVAAEGKFPLMDLLTMASDMPLLLEESLAVLRDDCNKWEAIQPVTKKDVHPQAQEQPTSTKHFVTRRLKLDIELDNNIDKRDLPPHTLQVLEALHKAYGGEFWINKRLCFKDGEMVSVPFEA